MIVLLGLGTGIISVRHNMTYVMDCLTSVSRRTGVDYYEAL